MVKGFPLKLARPQRNHINNESPRTGSTVGLDGGGLAQTLPPSPAFLVVSRAYSLFSLSLETKLDGRLDKSRRFPGTQPLPVLVGLEALSLAESRKAAMAEGKQLSALESRVLP